MTDFGHDLLFGAFLTPEAGAHEAILALTELTEDLGLDVLAFQDHPYQPGFLDMWTLLSYLGARTRRVRLVPDVANVPLRPPAVLARSAAALDILTDGRVELGLGAGYSPDAVASMGGPRLSPADSVDALAEAITVIRHLWTPGPPVEFAGKHHRLEGAAPGPPPRHPIGIWLGAYKRRMLELTARTADGWVPTSSYAPPEQIRAMTSTLDAAAETAGRDPGEIRRIYNVMGSFSGAGADFLQGPPAVWAEQLTELVLRYGLSGFILGPGGDPIGDLRRFAEEVAPAVREAVARERAAPPEPADRPGPAVSGAPARRAAEETERLVVEQEPVSAVGRAGQQTLLAVHAHLRQELDQLRAVADDVARGRMTAAAARNHVNHMTMRQNYWTLGAFCAAYCRVVTVHHTIEDERMFRDLRDADSGLGPVLDRLGEEHEAIAEMLTEVDAALVTMMADESSLGAARETVDRFAGALLAHLAYEEEQLLGPIGRLSIEV
jgi:alkanesulfonate monooxygenase SsuD/methylene tetrahydromethanopterin reductase-like flavin-dependent oxidoreductase (luciferase family)/hemerythrin-like domain-containing protein